MSTSTSRAAPLASSDPLHHTLAQLLDEIASETPAPGGGAVAAIAVALAASLVEMAGRFAQRIWDGGETAVSAAQALGARVAPLAQADADAYTDLLGARRRRPDDSARERALAEARSRVVEVPLEVAAIGAEVAALAAGLAERGNPNLRGDAIAAALLANAGAQVGAKLVEINVDGRADERLDRARDHVAAAAEAAERALAASGRVTPSPTALS
jgi:methenyltetrahydrofolate cyclohydrolase